MKTQEEYAREIDEIVRRDVESCQSDWFKIDKEIFMQPENEASCPDTSFSWNGICCICMKSFFYL